MSSITVTQVVRWEPDAEGRLITAALTLFDEFGYDNTTVAEIATRAGLTKRTFFRYFSDKREVLFRGSQDLQDLLVSGVAGAAAGATPMAAVAAGLQGLPELFLNRLPFAKIRGEVVRANAELQERELIKLHTLASAVEATLVARGAEPHAAALAAQSGITVFHTAFGRWVAQDDPAALARLIDQSLTELRSVVAT